MRNRIFEKITAVLCALCLAVAVMSGTVSAKDENEQEPMSSEPEAAFVVVDEQAAALDIVGSEVTDNRTSLPCYGNGQPVGSCELIDGVPFLSARAFCEAIGLDADVVDDGQNLTVTADGLSLTCTAGQAVFVCNDRYMYVESGVLSMNGEIYLPVEDLIKCFGISAEWDRSRWCMDICSGTAAPLQSGSDFYDETDVYWLSRLIYATAGDRELTAQIGVGSVIMNRMNDGSFADQDSVYDVIFAKNQFDVVINGMIYMTPDDTAVIAAKLAIEGYDTANGATDFTAGSADADQTVTAVLDGVSFTAALEAQS